MKKVLELIDLFTPNYDIVEEPVVDLPVVEENYDLLNLKSYELDQHK